MPSSDSATAVIPAIQAVAPRPADSLSGARPDTTGVAAADSLAAMSAGNALSFGEAQVCREEDGPLALTERISTTAVAPYIHGLAPQPRALLPGYDSGIVGMLLGALLLVALSIRHTGNFLKVMGHDLLSVRRRDNVFDEHTVSESRLTFSMILLTCISEGLILSLAPQSGELMTGLTPLGNAALWSAVAVGFYLFQTIAYATVGYVFGGGFQCSRWLKGFNASQCLLGLTLAPVAFVMLFNPGNGPTAVVIAAVLYGVARMVFICKGFRIFYKNPYSLIYFILYLCALEIVPLFWAYRTSANSGALNL